MAKKNGADISLTAEALSDLTRSLSGKQLRAAVRSALRREAGVLKRVAVASLKGYRTPVRTRRGKAVGGKPIANAGAIAKKIRAKAYRDATGLIVAANFSKRYKLGFYKGKSSKRELPVPYWLDQGTAPRSDSRRRGRGVNRGSIEAINFIKAADAGAAQSAQRLIKFYEDGVAKIVNRIAGRL